MIVSPLHIAARVGTNGVVPRHGCGRFQHQLNDVLRSCRRRPLHQWLEEAVDFS